MKTTKPKYPLNVHIDFGGPEYTMRVGKQTILFEMHNYFGPVRLSKATGSGHTQDFPRLFWPLFERWQIGGQKHNEKRECIVPDACPKCHGFGEEMKHLGGRNWQRMGICKACDGRKVKQ